MGLNPCPCGKTPTALHIEPGQSCKYSWVCGDCCGEWNVEFRTGYLAEEDPALMEIAIEVWNRATRATPKDTHADPA